MINISSIFWYTYKNIYSCISFYIEIFFIFSIFFQNFGALSSENGAVIAKNRKRELTITDKLVHLKNVFETFCCST